MKRLAILVLAGILLAACGGSSRLSMAEYQTHLQDDGKPVESAVKALTSAANITSLAQFATKADTAEAAVKNAADDLDSIKPPKDAEADNAAIVTGLRAIQSGLEKLKKVAASGSTAAVLAAAASLESSPQLKDAEKAITDLKQKGYKVGFLGV
jgi:hypothetical protein